MPQQAKYLALQNALALGGLLTDELAGVPGHVNEAVVHSLIHWWSCSKSAKHIRKIETTLIRLSDSAAGGMVVQRLVTIILSLDHALADRAVVLLGHLQSAADASRASLMSALTKNSGPDKWRVAVALAQLGVEDALIIEHLGQPPDGASCVSAVGHRSVRVFDLQNYHTLLEATLTASTNAEKGIALEDLAEYIFLCVPGLNTIDRNRRTVAEEIDISLSNDATGFWREMGDPFVVECKNVAAPVDAPTIRDFDGKLRTKGLKGGFLVTTSHLTECGKIQIRHSLAEKRIIVAIERKHLDAIAGGQQVAGVLQERFYTYRLL